MKQTLPIVHCIYTQEEIYPEALLEESFRLYLQLIFRRESCT